MRCGTPATTRTAVAELAQQGQAALGGRRVERTGDDEDLATLLHRPRGRDERAAASRGLDDDRGRRTGR